MAAEVSNYEIFKGLFGGPLLVFAGVAAYAYYVGGFDVLWYSTVYKVSADQVHVEKRPIDCDYYFAPVGYKGCQYKAVVKAYDKAGYIVAGDDPPIYSHDVKTGKPIVCDDKGKTWELFDKYADDVPDPKVTHFHVSWLKVTDWSRLL